MGRLSAPPPRLSGAPHRIGRAPDLARKPGRVRDAAPWRKWYGTPRWKKLRQAVLIRDAYICQRTGLICGGRYPAPDSPTVNHKRPHRGDPVLFWDPDNLETVSKEVHDTLIQREEQASLHQRGVWD